MKVHQLLDHYGITENPFAQEDASSDRVFKEHCLDGTHHSAWDKVYGDPRSPSTSVVFGEQGSGKTALRLQIVSKLEAHNREFPEQRAFIVEYDDYNKFLDCFRERLSSRQRKQEKALKNWRLWDHMDSILTLATTQLADAIRDNSTRTEPSQAINSAKLEQLTRPQKRDLLLLAACYDDNRDLSASRRWTSLRKKLGFSVWRSLWDRALGFFVTVITIGLVIWLGESWKSLFQWWVGAILAAGWLPYAWHQLRLVWLGWRIKKQIRIIDHPTSALRRILGRFEQNELIGQPLPSKSRSDDRYELLSKLQSVLKTLGFSSIYVLVDRVDEPHLVNGNAERIRDLIWPMFDNKFLKHPGIAFKLLLPAAVSGYLGKEEQEFYERSRLDKQNLVPSLSWTGQGLYDVANDRVRACAKLAEGTKPGIRDLFDSRISDSELIGLFDRLRAPRHLFKFLYRLLVDHCSKYTEDDPQWKIQPETLQSSLSLFMRDLQAYDEKRGTG
ncbi:MAG: hypothetical protein R3C01_06395 [Planctomycetaceae bacterium]